MRLTSAPRVNYIRSGNGGVSWHFADFKSANGGSNEGEFVKSSRTVNKIIRN